MIKHLKKLGIISAIALVFCCIIFRLDSKQTYETLQIQNEDIVRTLEFSTQIYPEYYTKIELGSFDEIEEVFVKDGDVLKKGDILVQLNDDSEQTSYNQAWNLYNQIIIYRNQLIEAQKSSVGSTDALEQSLNNNLVSITQIINETEGLDEEIKEVLNSEISSINDAMVSLTNNTGIVISGYDVKASMQPAINLAYASVESAREKVEARKIKAPFDGTVLHIQTNKYTEESSTNALESLDLNSIMEGMNDPASFLSSSLDLSSTTSTETNLREDNFIVFTDKSKVFLYTDFSEKEILEVSGGMNVDVKFENSKAKTTGLVEEVMSFPMEDGAEDPRYAVVISINELPENFLIGSTVSGSIRVYEKESAIEVPTSAIGYNDEEKAFVYQLDNDGNLVEKYVTIGDENLTKTEITEGLVSGDSIVVSKDKVITILVLRPWIGKLLGK